MARTASTKNQTTPRRRLVLLDMHALLHRAYHALPDFSTSAGEPSGALYGLAAMLIKAAGELKPDYIAAAYDLPQPTHRHEAFDGYKAGRAKTDDALIVQIERSRDVLAAFGIDAYEHEGFEADDILGTIVEQTKNNENLEIVIVTGDMDTLQLVDDTRVKVFTLRKGLNDTVLYGEKDVRARFGFGPELLSDYKGLRGDPSDNIPGVKGIGEKTATALITTFGDIPSIYAALERDDAKLKDIKITPRLRALLLDNREEADFSKLLGTIRRDAPITFVVPAHTWLDNLDIAAVTDCFAKLEFRSLVPRVKTLRGSAGEAGQSDRAAQETPPVPPRQESEPDPGLFAEAQIMLWLLNSDLTNPSLDDVLEQTRTDTLVAAHAKLTDDLAAIPELKKVFDEIEKPLIPILARMKNDGIKLDASYLEGLASSYHAELSDLEKKIWHHAGKEFNINSPRQLGEVLYGDLGLKGGRKTATGQRSTKESELEKLREGHPIIAEILAYRELQKLLSTYIDAFPKMLDEQHRLHTTFIQTGAATGRMSSQAPNLQNIPIKTELGRAVRGAFVAERGSVLLALDYSQIELRIAAIMSCDPKLVATFESGGDIHTAVAAEIFDVSPGDVTHTMRRTAKVINFGILYGMGANALAATAEMSRADAQKYLADYMNTFTGLADYMSRVRGEARRNGYTTTLFGRRRHLAGLRSPLPYVRAEAERQAVNAPIQGTSADIIKIAMARIDDEIVAHDRNAIRLVLQVHDELIYEVVEDAAEAFAPRIKHIMESVTPDELRDGVPIVVEASVGKRWSEMKKI